MTIPLIGRVAEKKVLTAAFDSKEAEFLLVYGRRRIGKTFLIRRFFEKKPCFFFQITGINQAPLDLQLREFKNEIERVFFYGGQQGPRLQEPQNWLDAFTMLNQAIVLFGKRKKVVIFLDEFPWLATRKSGVLQALDYMWNRFWVNAPRIKLIVCGSAASWMIENILNNKKGLHNRVTRRLRLEPFTLVETQGYLKHQGICLTQNQILSLYMCIGGVPYYLRSCEKGLSATQIINQLCFHPKGVLRNEFQNLFSSLFEHAESHEVIIRLIASQRGGISRKVIEETLELKGGRLTSRLKELEEAGFIMTLMPQGRERGTFYKVIDEYTLFYLSWIAPTQKARFTQDISDAHWEVLSQTAAWKDWSGYAFEAVCYKHLLQIRKALKIPEGSLATSWRFVPPAKSTEEGAQIDLLFNRPDSVVNLCEIKYCTSPYTLDKAYAQDLARKARAYQSKTKIPKQIFFSMITASRLKKNLYAEEFISSEVMLEDLFEERGMHSLFSWA